MCVPKNAEPDAKSVLRSQDRRRQEEEEDQRIAPTRDLRLIRLRGGVLPRLRAQPTPEEIRERERAREREVRQIITAQLMRQCEIY